MHQSVKRGTLAKITGCNIETIRYYENIALLRPVDRTSSGHRLYSPDDQARLRFILRAFSALLIQTNIHAARCLL